MPLLPPWSTRMRRRIARHHLPLAALTLASLLLLSELDGAKQGLHRWSIATAYAGLALLAATLIIGPLNVARRRPNPVSADLRRDIAIWAGTMGIAHFVLGLQIHMQHRWLYFVRETSTGALVPRTDVFGFANDTGLAATLVLAFLLALSNDRSLRRLGTDRWKRYQRWSYAGAGLVLLHTVAYQVIEKRKTPWVLAGGAVIAVTLIAQGAGYDRIRKQAERHPQG